MGQALVDASGSYDGLKNHAVGVAQSIVIAWVVTIPAAAIVAALFYWAATKLG